MWFGSDNSYCQGRIDVQLDVRQIQNVPAQRDQVFELQASQSHKQDTKLHTDQTSLYPHPTQSRKNSIICCFSDISACQGLIFGVCLFGVLPPAKVSQYSNIFKHWSLQTKTVGQFYWRLQSRWTFATTFPGSCKTAQLINANGAICKAPVESMMRILHGCTISTVHPTEKKRKAYLCLKRGVINSNLIFFSISQGILDFRCLFPQCLANLYNFCICLFFLEGLHEFQSPWFIFEAFIVMWSRSTWFTLCVAVAIIVFQAYH